MTSQGFDSLPNQQTTRVTTHGTSFNVMFVGQASIGKTTLINSLFDFDYGDLPDLERESRVILRIKEFRPKNKDEMRLTIIETKGLNNQLDNSKSYQPIVDYIDEKYEEFLMTELSDQEDLYNDITDNRVHCCIYMIAPLSSGLKPIDLITMKQLHQKVRLIPVIGKSDTLTKQERMSLKEKIRHQISSNGIQIHSSDEHNLPLAIAASNEVLLENGKRHRTRQYPFGKMDIEANSEFPRLKDLVLRSSMLSLIEATNKIHYEKYRKEALQFFKTPSERAEEEFNKYRRCYEAEKALLLKEIEKLEKERPRTPYKRASLLSSSYVSTLSHI